MSRESTLTVESFESLLSWLDSEREIAGQKYETIRNRLIKIFHHRKCSNPEELADTTINRVAGKVKEISEGYNGNPAAYFYGVAQKIALEAQRRQPESEIDLELIQQPSTDGYPEEDNARYKCLDKCLTKLPGDDNRLVINYYSTEQKSRIDSHYELAKSLGLTPNTLRVRAFRIRQRLQKCVIDCVKQSL